MSQCHLSLADPFISGTLGQPLACQRWSPSSHPLGPDWWSSPTGTDRYGKCNPPSSPLDCPGRSVTVWTSPDQREVMTACFTVEDRWAKYSVIAGVMPNLLGRNRPRRLPEKKGGKNRRGENHAGQAGLASANGGRGSQRQGRR